jgi:ABC-type dipeptide/oligopeptide/nickel transport system ATPase component
MTTQDTKPRSKKSSGSQFTYTPQDGLLLEVEDLFVEFHTHDGVATAINGVSFDLYQGETLAILGESGSGKSVTAQAIMGILDMPPAVIPHGHIRYCGQDLLSMPNEQRRLTRGPEVSMIFQDALSSLNPVFPVGWQIAEMFRTHRGINRSDSLELRRAQDGTGPDDARADLTPVRVCLRALVGLEDFHASPRCTRFVSARRPGLRLAVGGAARSRPDHAGTG